MSDQAPLVSLILVTMRPVFLPAMRVMLDGQIYRNTERVIVLHGYRAADLDRTQRQALASARAVLELPRDWSLGRCLNAAIAEARGQFIAKIDDDDLYGRAYLQEAVAHLSAGDGDIVGKAESYAYLEGSGVILLRRPGSSFARVNYVYGPTLVFTRELARAVPFRDVTLREDTYFLDDCRSNGKTVYAASRRNFMYLRRTATDSHTSPYPDADFLGSGIVMRRRPRATRAELSALIDGDAEEVAAHAAV
jgi:hypothetical protein